MSASPERIPTATVAEDVTMANDYMEIPSACFFGVNGKQIAVSDGDAQC